MSLSDGIFDLVCIIIIYTIYSVSLTACLLLWNSIDFHNIIQCCTNDLPHSFNISREECNGEKFIADVVLLACAFVAIVIITVVPCIIYFKIQHDYEVKTEQLEHENEKYIHTLTYLSNQPQGIATVSYENEQHNTSRVEDSINKLSYLRSNAYALCLKKESEVYKCLSALMTNTWSYESRLGKDSRNRTHRAILPEKIFQLINPKMKKKYRKACKTLNFKYPTELLMRPILTKSCDLYGMSLIEGLCSNEVWLFHGTKLENIVNIIEHGYDLGLAKHGLYGKGIYLAESSEKADQYTDDNSQRRDQYLAMIVVRVNLGHVGCYGENPTMNVLEHGVVGSNKCQATYDSIVAGLDKRFREFVVYNPDICYPEYVILYTRKHDLQSTYL